MLRNPLYVYSDEEIDVPSHLNFGRYIVNTLWSYGDKTALINGITHEKLTYRDIVKDAMKIALSLTRMGVKRGDTIAIYSENRNEFWSTFIGITCTGAIFTPANELEHVLTISKPKMIFCSPFAYKSHGETLRNLRFVEKIILFGQDRAANTLLYDDLAKGELNCNVNNFVTADVKGETDTAVILYSSGTTGLSKGVMLTHLNIIAACNGAPGMNPFKLSLMIAPWNHSLGLLGILTNFKTGGTLVYLPKFESDLYLKTIEKYQIYQILVPPPVLIALCKIRTKYNVTSVELIGSGAAPLKTDTIEAVKKRFPNVTNVLQGYGLTESTFAITKDVYDKAHLAKIGSVGPAVSSFIIKIVDIETRKPLGVNETGEICVKGPLIMKGYVGRDISDDLDDEGFFKTGDIGYYDKDKCFFVVDRLKELIKYKGYQVPPAEIEAVLLQHPNILDVAVIGIPNDSAGEVPRAYVVLQPRTKLSEEEIKTFVAEKLSYQKHLRGGVHFVNEIPKNASGKILRRKLREMAKKTEVKSKL